MYSILWAALPFFSKTLFHKRVGNAAWMYVQGTEGSTSQRSRVWERVLDGVVEKTKEEPPILEFLPGISRRKKSLVQILHNPCIELLMAATRQVDLATACVIWPRKQCSDVGKRWGLVVQQNWLQSQGGTNYLWALCFCWGTTLEILW